MTSKQQPPTPARRPLHGDEVADIAEEFDACDTDGDRRIDFVEFSQLLEGLGTELTVEQQRARFSEIDTDGDGAIDRQEFIEWWRRV